MLVPLCCTELSSLPTNISLHLCIPPPTYSLSFFSPCVFPSPTFFTFFPYHQQSGAHCSGKLRQSKYLNFRNHFKALNTALLSPPSSLSDVVCWQAHHMEQTAPGPDCPPLLLPCSQYLTRMSTRTWTQKAPSTAVTHNTSEQGDGCHEACGQSQVRLEVSEWVRGTDVETLR